MSATVNNILSLIPNSDSENLPDDPDEILDDAIHEVTGLTERVYAQKRKSIAKKLRVNVSDLDVLVRKERQRMSDFEHRDLQLRDDGLYRLDNHNSPLERLTDAFHILGGAKNKRNLGHALQIEIPTDNDKSNLVIIPKSMLTSEGRDAVQLLLDAGLRFTQAEGAQRMLIRYLCSVKPEKSITMVDKPGFEEGVYVTASGNIPADNDTYILNTDSPQLVDFDQSGPLEGWQQSIGAKALNNLYLILALCVAFAAPLLPLMGMNSFIIHLVGNSSTGKSTAQYVANSVYGSWSRFKTWRATDNALEAIAQAFNHSLLILDEVSQVPAKLIGPIAYMLGNGQGKQRANKIGLGRETRSWSTTVLSSGEETLEQVMTTAGQSPKAGQETRFIDISIHQTTPHGLFHCLHGIGSGAIFANLLKLASGTSYGTAGAAYIAAILSASKESVADMVHTSKERFTLEYLPPSANGQVCRVCDIFALLAAAGELAIHFGILPWPAGHAFDAIGQLFNQWLAERGGIVAKEEIRILQQVKYIIERFGDSRFEELEPPIEGEYRPTIHDRAGYRRKDENGSIHHYVLPNVFRQDVCKGFNPKLVIAVLTQAGILQRPANGDSSMVMKDSSGKPQRCYHLKDILSLEHVAQ